MALSNVQSLFWKFSNEKISEGNKYVTQDVSGTNSGKTTVKVNKTDKIVEFTWNHNASLKENLTKILQMYKKEGYTALLKKRKLYDTLQKMVLQEGVSDSELLDELKKSKIDQFGFDGKESIFYHVQLLAQYDDEKMREINKKLHQLNRGLEQQNINERKELIDTKQSLQEAKERINVLQQQLQHEGDNKSKKEAEFIKAHAKISENERQLNENQDKIKNLESKVAEYEAKIKKLDTITLVAQEEQKANRDVLDKRQTQIETLEKEQQEMEKVHAALTETKDNLEEKLLKQIELNKENEKKLKTFSNISDLIVRSGVSGENKEGEWQADTFLKNLNAVVTQDKNKMKEQKLTRENKNLRKNINEQVNEISRQYKKINTLEQENATLQEVNEKMKKKIEEIHLDRESIDQSDQSQNISTLKENNHKLKEENKTLKDKNSELSSKVSRLTLMVNTISNALCKVLGIDLSSKNLYKELKNPQSKVSQQITPDTQKKSSSKFFGRS